MLTQTTPWTPGTILHLRKRWGLSPRRYAPIRGNFQPESLATFTEIRTRT
jgi:hypothetical protein